MVLAAPATDLVPLPANGRRFSARRPVRLGDVDVASELRLDAIARYLQDVATDDATSSGLVNALGWVVRRSLVDVRRPAVLDETVELTTFCSGTGRSWAERRTSITGDAGAHIEASSLWVQIDVDAGRPAPLGDDFFAIYGEASGRRKISSRLSLPEPPPEAVRRPWLVRAVDLDPFHHVNNAAQWAVLEEIALDRGDGRVGTAEMEFVGPVDRGIEVELSVDDTRDGEPLVWVVTGDRVLTAARWRPGGPSSGAVGPVD